MPDISSIFNLEGVLDSREAKERELTDEFIRRLNDTFSTLNEIRALGHESLGQLAYNLLSQARSLDPEGPARRLTEALAASLLVIQANAELDEAMD